MILYFAQTPELADLPSPQERDAVHAIAWRQLKSEQPELWRRSFWIVIGCGALACLLGYLLLSFLPDGPWEIGPFQAPPLAFLGGIAGGLGAVIHIHLTASALRPYYASIIASRELR
ncbi:hypothetical protein [Aureliella helgolandensis]|uniref:Uncharacterized protein n=1 Tax=Aureliella helgolandensis TaxID=2527968 RepID=A0A518G5I4_9BACT|nr:hypothetical protein [Aureliella helgolandensis]QDV23842.1 hypothetical protein Q31a_21480 [Aureliella helgolandensis]